MGSRGGSDLCSFLLKAAAAGLLSQNVFATEDDHNSTTTTVVNGTVTKPTYAAGDLVEWFSSNNEMLLRMSYVLLAVTLLIVLYFAVKTCRLRRKSNVRRYDVLNAKKLETEFALDVDDSSEDEVYDSQKSLVKPQPPSPKR